MLWANIASVVVGYLILEPFTYENEFVAGLLAFLGAIGSTANLFFSIMLQARGWKEAKIYEGTIFEE